MREQRQIVQQWRHGSASILITLIGVQGSSYRQPGARLLICKDGTYAGSISGGCLEADLLRKAAWMIRNGSVVERYSTLIDEIAEIPFGLGCGGILDVLLEAAELPEGQALLLAIESALAGDELLIATWLPNDERPMRRAIFRPDGELIFASSGLSAEALFEARMKRVHNANADCDGMFVEQLVSPQRLFIFGAGDDAKPLVTMGCLLGWSVTVIDGRMHLAHKARFPESNAEVVSAPDTVIRKISSRDAVVIMSHSYEQDRDYLASLLPLRPRYLGLLGSRQRSSLLISEAAARLEMSLSDCCEYVCAPVGLDIGGEGPEAIALAILAEAQACCMGKGSQSRKLSPEDVERYLVIGDAKRYIEAQCGLDAI
jgi:xanthine dehydrogenase accessory factor